MSSQEDKIKAINKQKDELQDKFQSDRIELEDTFNEELEKLNVLLKQNQEDTEEFNKRAGHFPDAVDSMFNDPNARFIDKYPNSAEKMMGKYQDMKDQLVKKDQIITDGIDQLNKAYNDEDDKLLENFTNENHKLDLKIDEIKSKKDDDD